MEVVVYEQSRHRIGSTPLSTVSRPASRLLSCCRMRFRFFRPLSCRRSWSVDLESSDTVVELGSDRPVSRESNEEVSSNAGQRLADKSRCCRLVTGKERFGFRSIGSTRLAGFLAIGASWPRSNK